MILVTVGGQLPFDRLVSAVDSWAAQNETASAFAQIGDSASPPSTIQWQRFLSREEFDARMRAAEVIVAHAGMGTILTAIELEKPIVVMPRRAHLGEHRNDHQWATAKRLPARLGVHVASDEQELRSKLDGLNSLPPACANRGGPEHLLLIAYLREFVAS